MLKNKSSLYRIYRPSTFKDVAGHKNVVEILKKTLSSNSFSHAFLFAGQKGTGKTSIARIVAKAVNCKELVASNPCEKCETCIVANQGKSPDIYEIDAASNNGVDEIRGIKNNVSTLPIAGKYKVYIVDEVHMLSKGAFNALLKTLEEPPSHALFILATTEFAKIPQTIVSRCQTFNFKKIDKKALEERLFYVAQQEGFEIDLDVVEEIYFLSDGSLRDALNVLEQLMIVNNQKISLESLKKIFYIASKKEKLKVLENVLNNKPQELISYFENAENQGMDFDVFALGLIEIVKEIIEYKLTKNGDFLKILNLKDLQDLNGSLDKYFFIADQLSEAYSKTRGTNVSFNYILISLLKSLNLEISAPKVFEEKQSFINSQENPKKPLTTNQPDEKDGEFSPSKEQQVVEIFDQTIFEKIKTPTSSTPNISKEELPQLEENKEITSQENQNHLANTISDLIEAKLKLISQNNFSKGMVVENHSVMNLLVNAKKEDRNQISSQIEKLFEVDQNNQFINPKLANELIAFYGSKISAASDCEVLVRFETEPGANLLKKSLVDGEYQKKLTKLLNKEYVFYVVDDDQWETIKIEFLFNKKNKTLPEHQHVKVKEFYQSAILKERQSNSQSELFARATQLFGDDIKFGD